MILVATLLLTGFLSCGGTTEPGDDQPVGPQLSQLVDVGMSESTGGTHTLTASTDPPDSRPRLEWEIEICGEDVSCFTQEGVQDGPELRATVSIVGGCVTFDWRVELVYIGEDFQRIVADGASGTHDPC